jgi:hypothetical protein
VGRQETDVREKRLLYPKLQIPRRPTISCLPTVCLNGKDTALPIAVTSTLVNDIMHCSCRNIAIRCWGKSWFVALPVGEGAIVSSTLLDSLQKLAYREVSCWGPGSDSVDHSPPQRLPADSEIR